MKVRIAFTEDERETVEIALEALRRVMPDARTKETEEKDGFHHVFVTTRHCIKGKTVV